MRPIIAGLMVTCVLSLFGNRSEAASAKPLNGQIKSLAVDLKEVLATDPKLKGQKLRVGSFSGPQLVNSNFGPQLKKAFEDELKEVVDAAANLTLTGRYDFVESENDTSLENSGKKLQVIRITAAIEDKAAREQAKKSIEINDSDDIAQILGLTVAPPLNGEQGKRNDEVKKAQEKPAFRLVDKTKVGVSNFDENPFLVEVLTKTKVDLPPEPAPVKDQKGTAFVDIPLSSFYEIRLHNQAEFEAAASVAIDGLDVLNTFKKDAAKYRAYVVPPKSSLTIRGWLHKTDQSAQDNVLAFLVTELGKGAGTAQKSKGPIGVITVVFHASWKENEEPPASEKGPRSAGRETAAGEALPEKMEVLKRNIGLARATISLRYSPLEAK